MGLIFSGVKRLILHTDSKVDLTAFRNGLGALKAGDGIPGAHRPKPPLRCLRFVPSVTEISPSGLCDDEESITD